MHPDRFTIKAQEALAAAQRLAGARRNPQVAPQHVLVSLLEQEGGIVGVDAGTYRAVVDVAGSLSTYTSRTSIPASVARSRCCGIAITTACTRTATTS